MEGAGRAEPTRDELWTAMRRDSQGMRELRRFLDEIEHLDDDAFAAASDGGDRMELMQLRDRLRHLLSELDTLTAQLHLDVN